VRDTFSFYVHLKHVPGI